jgi:hypothetical protein
MSRNLAVAGTTSTPIGVGPLHQWRTPLLIADPQTCTVVCMRTGAAFAFCMLLGGATSCGDVSDNTARSVEPRPMESALQDAGTDEADAGSDAGAGLIEASPHFVAMELPPVVGRSVEVRQDGSVVWGEVEPLDEVTSCIIERRDAYAVFQPYEPLDEPLCVTTAAQEFAYFDQVPENSDLTLTLSKPGYLPQVLSQRVETWDVTVHSDVRNFLVLVLLEEQQAQLLGPRSSSDLDDGLGEPDTTNEAIPSDDRGLLMVQGWMSLLAAFPPATESLFSSFRDPGVYPVEKSALTVSALRGDGGPDDGDPPAFERTAELELDGAPLLMDVPATTYRTHLDHPRSACEPMGLPYALFFSGLGTGMAGELEARVLPGHVTGANYVCLCARTSQQAQLVDPGQCLFEEP